MVQFRGATFILSDVNIICNRELQSTVRKQCWEKSGIYRIYNNVSGNCYIGLAKNIYNRITYGHIHDLTRNIHGYSNGKPDLLQKAWNKYGSSAFSYEIMEYCPVDRLEEREIFWIDYFKCNNTRTGKGYNLTDGGNCPPTDGRGTRGKKLINNVTIQKCVFPEELEEHLECGWVMGQLQKYKDRQSATMKAVYEQERKLGILRTFSAETKQKMHDAHYRPGYKCRQKGEYTPSEETRKKIGNAHRGTTQTEESNKKRSETMLSKHLTHSPESIAKMIKKKEKAVVQFDLEGNFVARYDSAQKAAKSTGEHPTYISTCCNHKTTKYKNSIWRFENEKKEPLGMVH